MKKYFLPYLVVLAMSLISLPVLAQTAKDTASLGLPGDNLDLYAVLDLFLKSKTIEDFEKSLNEQKTGINNLDLDLDGKVDFIKVVTEKKGDSYIFTLQDAVSKTETQDVAVILVDKDKNKKVTVQIVGDEVLYGKDYVIEPKTSPTPSVTANPAYTGPEPVTQNVPATTTTVVVQSAPIVQYVYSPVYVPYYPPYYYGYYPPYFAAFTVMAVGIYRHNNYYYHGGYYGGHYGGGNTVIINNKNNYVNHYNNNRNTSERVQHNNASGKYNNGNRPSTQPSNRQGGGASASTQPSNRQGGGASASTQPSNRTSGGAAASTRQSGGFQSSGATRPSTSNYSSGGGRSMSGGSGGYGGGGGRSGGGGGGRRR